VVQAQAVAANLAETPRNLTFLIARLKSARQFNRDYLGGVGGRIDATYPFGKVAYLFLPEKDEWTMIEVRAVISRSAGLGLGMTDELRWFAEKRTAIKWN
jgi:hypothetical protein